MGDPTYPPQPPGAPPPPGHQPTPPPVNAVEGEKRYFVIGPVHGPYGDKWWTVRDRYYGPQPNAVEASIAERAKDAEEWANKMCEAFNKCQ